jgi:hypothetical protein
MRSIVQYAFLQEHVIHTRILQHERVRPRERLSSTSTSMTEIRCGLPYKGASLHILASAHASLRWELLSAKHKEQNLEPDTVQPHICSFTQEDGMRRRGTHGAAYHHSHRYPAVTFKSHRQTQNLTGTISHSAPLRHFSTSNSRCEEFPKLLLE